MKTKNRKSGRPRTACVVPEAVLVPHVLSKEDFEMNSEVVVDLLVRILLKARTKQKIE